MPAAIDITPDERVALNRERALQALTNRPVDRLLPTQQKMVQRYRDHYFRLATCTKPADRQQAEQATRDLLRLMQYTCPDRVIWVASPEQHSQQVNGSLSVSLSISLWGSLWGSLSGSLWRSLSDSLSGSLYDSLLASLYVSLYDSLSGSPWLAIHSFLVDLVAHRYSQHQVDLIASLNRIAGSCFAVWVHEDVPVFCERPTSVEIQDGKLKSLEWGSR